MIEGLKSEIRKLYKIISLFLTLALQSLNKNQSKIQENVKNGEKITNHKKSFKHPPGFEPWTFLIEQAYSTQNRVHDPTLPALSITHSTVYCLKGTA